MTIAEETKKLTRKEKKALKERLKHLKSGKLEKRYDRMGFIFMIPWFIGAAAFLAYPLGSSFWYALNNIRITPRGRIFNFVGQGNFTQILIQDPDFMIYLVDYLTSTIISTPIIVVFALIIAMMLNMRIKGKGFFRLIFFLPVIIVSGPILGMLTAEGAGSISAIDTQSLSAAISSVLPSIIADPISDVFNNMITTLWYSGVQILIFLSGLQKIDKSMYEAAKIDGGSAWECFWKITLPNLKSMILLNTIYTIVFISNNSDNPIIILIQESMFSGTKEKGYGYASAMAWLYSIVVLVLVGLFTLILSTRKDQYEKEVKRAKKARKKEIRNQKRIERRNRRNAKRIERQREKGKITTHTTHRDDY